MVSMSDISKGFRPEQIQLIAARESKLRAYEEALRIIEKFGHSHGHGRGYTCANIAEKVLKDESRT